MAGDNAYRIEFTDRALDDIRNLSEKNRRIVNKKLNGLAINPRPIKAEKIKGADVDSYRVRAGNYRICYTIEDGKLTVLVLMIGDRKEVYKDLKDYLG